MHVEHLYDTAKLLAQAAQWRQKASQTDQPDIRDDYLREALRYEEIVRRSMEAPLFRDSDLKENAA
jgi:hypothetical protein